MLSALQIAAQGLAPNLSGLLAAVQGFAAAVGGGVPGGTKKRFVQRIGDRLVVFNNATDALRAADSVKTAAPAVQSGGQKASPVIESVEIARIEAQAAAFDQASIAADLIKRAQYAKAMELFEALQIQQDEEDVEALLMAVH